MKQFWLLLVFFFPKILLANGVDIATSMGTCNPNQSIKQVGSSKKENCIDAVKKTIDMTFSPAVTTNLSSVNWVIDGISQVTASDFSTTKTYTSSGVYQAQMIAHYVDGCTDDISSVVNIYEPASVELVRDNNLSTCAPYTEQIIIKVTEPIANTTKITWNFGDNTASGELSNPPAQYKVQHIYTTASCNGDFVVNKQTICTNCFGIAVTAVNHCADIPSIKVAAPIIVFSKPKSDFVLEADSLKKTTLVANASLTNWLGTTLYQLCTPSAVVLKNATETGTGYGEDGQCQTADTSRFEIYSYVDKTTGVLERTCLQKGCDSIFHWDFKTRGVYNIKLTQSNSCGEDTITKRLIVRQRPQLYFDLGGSIECYPSIINFKNHSDTLSVYNWIFDSSKPSISTTSYNPSPYTYVNEGDYRVSLLGQDDFCENRYDTIISLHKLCENLYVPNAFLPESNDEQFRLFRPVANNLIDYKIEIYSLRGERLWESTQIANGQPLTGWDGTYKGSKCPSDTYMWKIEAKFIDGMGYTRQWQGQLESNGKYRRVGTLTLIR